jgi:O-antigen/teichoic acid export membrane protein
MFPRQEVPATQPGALETVNVHRRQAVGAAIDDAPVQVGVNLVDHDARRSTRRVFLASTGWSALAQICIKASTAGGALLLALMLAPRDLGKATAATSLALIFGVVFDAGFSVAVIRQQSSGAWSPRATRAAALAWRRRALVPATIAAGIATFASPHLGGRSLVPAVLVYMLGTSFAGLGAALLNGLHRFRDATIAIVVGRGLGCACLLADLALHGPSSPAVVVMLLAAGEVVTAVVAFVRFAALAPADSEPCSVDSSDAIKAAAPFALSTFFTLVYNRADVYIVTIFAGTQVAGIYSPASQLQNAMMVLPGIAGAATIPLGTRLLANRDRAGVLWLVRSSLRLSLALTLPACVLLWLALPRVLSHALGSSYSASATPARLLLLSLPLLAIEIPLLGILTAAAPRSASAVYGLGLIVCVTAHALLDRTYGPDGAAIAALTREPVILVGALFALRRYASQHSPTRTGSKPVTTTAP